MVRRLDECDIAELYSMLISGIRQHTFTMRVNNEYVLATLNVTDEMIVNFIDELFFNCYLNLKNYENDY